MLPIKEENKLFSKSLTKESSIANPSFRVYYGGNSVGVPFVWEAKPGTPKHTKHGFSNEENNKDYLPPLTPPPSYYLKQPHKFPSKRSNSSKILLGLLPKSMHTRQISSASSSSSSTLSSSSVSEKGSGSSRRRRTLSSPGSLFDFIVNVQEDDEDEDVRSPTTVLCFGFVGSRRIRSCSIVDH